MKKIALALALMFAFTTGFSSVFAAEAPADSSKELQKPQDPLAPTEQEGESK
ncbi:MAG: hypothetical protein SFT93_03985 [Rickettsiaceae bacterium]|nr:hypothetical protein [Rickettsiaceae bacterium]